MNATAKAAYTAGIIDGEGSICMTNRSRKSKNFHWRITIEVANCDRIIIEWLYKNWGGRTVFNKIDKRPNNRPKHIWIADGDTVRHILNIIFPYLIIKKKRAFWAQEAIRIQKEKLVEGYKYTEKAKAKLLELRRQFQDDSRSLSIIKY